MRYDQLDIRRRRFAGILLAVYLPLLAVLMLHTHGASSATARAEREVILAAAGTMTGATHHADCPLCTFLHTTYLPPVTPAVEAAPVRPLPEVIFPYHFVVLPAALPHRSPRAPPVIGLVYSTF